MDKTTIKMAQKAIANDGYYDSGKYIYSVNYTTGEVKRYNKRQFNATINMLDWCNWQRMGFMDEE